MYKQAILKKVKHSDSLKLLGLLIVIQKLSFVLYKEANCILGMWKRLFCHPLPHLSLPVPTELGL